jgi:hypothetical protein
MPGIWLVQIVETRASPVQLNRYPSIQIFAITASALKSLRGPSIKAIFAEQIASGMNHIAPPKIHLLPKQITIIP